MKWIAHTRGGDKKSKSLFRMYYIIVNIPEGIAFGRRSPTWMDYRASRRNRFWACGLAVAADLWRVSQEDAAVERVHRWYFINTMLNLPLQIKLFFHRHLYSKWFLVCCCYCTCICGFCKVKCENKIFAISAPGNEPFECV